ncbi:hypothetical protein BAZ12_19555 [Elizabethkingia miricola]|jgi:hypothetical protein|uniref:Uncharacterized protein n=1 Tax=Elizabethkingia miricola TaxID=172045 RepID=A0ABD4DQU6_ELIMR|nr:hypothetical protein [Elizabethkingia miricola]KUY20853.1 hypothetical protein ATB95_08125 [Elizabethkingia miricola]MCL1652934.1 hypothetical protein [Elizabethkingia miricola]OPC76208.1 hypothetical protein BAZ12_19555 [Elizabethkingia miricola]SPW34226.1 Uncharacterised protein [Elizabethkingia miricola]
MDNTTTIIELAKENALYNSFLTDIVFLLSTDKEIVIQKYKFSQSSFIFNEIKKLKELSAKS